MKIALIGEFSGVHAGLKAGLEDLGHDVDIYSNGDGFKKINSDRALYPNSSGLFRKLYYLIFGISRLLRSISRDYDVVQIVNPHVIHTVKDSPGYYRWIIKNLSKGKGIKSLAVAGCEANTQRGLSSLVRSPCPGCLREIDVANCPYTSKNYIKIMRIAEDLSEHIIPFGGPSYAQSYRNQKKYRQLLPFPVDIRLIPERKNKVNGKIRVLHGLNRVGFKGSNEIMKALKMVEATYPDIFEIIIVDKLPFDDYIKLLSNVNIVIDQLYGDGLGMNALYSMASSCVVFTCFDRVEIGELNLTDAPAIQLKLTSKDICQQICELKGWSDDEYISVGRKSRYFVETRSSPVEIAKQVLEYWTSSVKVPPTEGV